MPRAARTEGALAHLERAAPDRRVRAAKVESAAKAESAEAPVVLRVVPLE
jgi:hypothetical protein